MTDTAFLFDFDGTITAAELLPLIAEELGVQEEIRQLTEATIAGLVPFDESLRTRVDILGGVPVDVVADIIDATQVHQGLLDWVLDHRDDCWIVTGNLDCWVDRWMQRHGLRYFSSRAVPDGDGLRLEHVLRKETVLGKFAGRRTVMVGDGANDAQIVADADIGIAVTLTHDPAPALLDVADVVVMDEETLCRTLSRL